MPSSSRASAPHLDSSTTTASRTDALARLTPFGWRGGLAAILGGLALSFFLFGYAIVYWRNADMDFMIVYNALVMNDGKPQEYFDHPAYWTIVSVKLWFQLLHGIGLLDAWTLPAIPSARDVPAFDAAMTQAVRAGRVIAWLTATGLVLVFAALIRRVFADWRIALLAVFAFAYSGGVAVHMRILRSELIAASLPLFGLLILIIVGRRATALRPLWIGVAAMLCMLGLENKVHAILLVMTLPALAIAFGAPGGASIAAWRGGSVATLGCLIGAVVAALALWAAWPLLVLGWDPAAVEAAGLRPLLAGRFGVYQPAIAVWVIACVMAYALIWRISAWETLATLLAIVAGLALGLMGLKLIFHVNDLVAVFNPLERMLTFAVAENGISAQGGVSGALIELRTHIIAALKRYTFVLQSSPRPTVFLTWLILPGIVLAWRRRARMAALQATLLLLAVLAIDTVGIRRGLKPEYIIFTDPLIVLAGAVLLERLGDLRFARWAYPIGATLMVVHIGMSQAEPVKHVLKRSGPEYICEWNQEYEPLLPMPWCDKPPAR